MVLDRAEASSSLAFAGQDPRSTVERRHYRCLQKLLAALVANEFAVSAVMTILAQIDRL